MLAGNNKQLVDASGTVFPSLERKVISKRGAYTEINTNDKQQPAKASSGNIRVLASLSRLSCALHYKNTHNKVLQHRSAAGATIVFLYTTDEEKHEAAITGN